MLKPILKNSIFSIALTSCVNISCMELTTIKKSQASDTELSTPQFCRLIRSATKENWEKTPMPEIFASCENEKDKAAAFLFALYRQDYNAITWYLKYKERHHNYFFYNKIIDGPRIIVYPHDLINHTHDKKSAQLFERFGHRPNSVNNVQPIHNSPLTNNVKPIACILTPMLLSCVGNDHETVKKIMSDEHQLNLMDKEILLNCKIDKEILLNCKIDKEILFNCKIDKEILFNCICIAIERNINNEDPKLVRVFLNHDTVNTICTADDFTYFIQYAKKISRKNKSNPVLINLEQMLQSKTVYDSIHKSANSSFRHAQNYRTAEPEDFSDAAFIGEYLWETTSSYVTATGEILKTKVSETTQALKNKGSAAVTAATDFASTATQTAQSYKNAATATAQSYATAAVTTLGNYIPNRPTLPALPTLSGWGSYFYSQQPTITNDIENVSSTQTNNSTPEVVDNGLLEFLKQLDEEEQKNINWETSSEDDETFKKLEEK